MLRRNATNRRVADYVNKLCANDPLRHQVYYCGLIASELGLSLEDVTKALYDPGSPASSPRSLARIL
jgi:hypothetical protein